MQLSKDAGRPIAGAAAAICLPLLAACSPEAPPARVAAVEDGQSAADSSLERAEQQPTSDDARAFIADAESRLEAAYEYAGRIAWVQSTYINDDTDWLAARNQADMTRLDVELANGTKAFESLDLDDTLARKMNLLRIGSRLPAPSADGAAEELAELSTWLGSTYATGTFTLDDRTLDLEAAEAIIGSSHDPDELAAAWAGWRTAAEPMAEPYADMVAIANDGARELGFDDLSELWLSGYEMSPTEMEAEVDRLWGQVEPLYEQLHCHVRAELNRFYGNDVQPATGPIRADLLGNMWAQSWANIYDIVAPDAGGSAGIDLTSSLVEQNYTPERMIETGEAFFSSLGFEPLPETFWERSLIVRPRDRSVDCHASAASIDGDQDIRIKMCTNVDAEDFRVIHHELGHVYYARAYADQDILFRNGAHDGFHEAIGDFVALSITPTYLRDIGLIDEIPDSSADTDLLMQQALDKIAFLPFGLLMDQWRWRVLRGDVEPDQYNALWWELRERYQGIEPPVDRSAEAFDPGAKFHIPGNVPYLRYFLSYIMQFQFHEAACEILGWEGPLHRCSVYGSEEVGRRFKDMMALGQSQPWPDALEAFTGTRDMDASAIIAYFAPLMDYLEQRNAGRACGDW